MNRQKLTIRYNRQVARDTYRMDLATAERILMRSGQFVDIAVEGKFLRRPISVCDADGEGITIIYKVVGDGTRILSGMKAGETLDVLTSLGHGFNPEACRSDALLIGGGLGSAPMYLLCKELQQLGKRVGVVLGFNNSEDVILYDEFKALGIEPVIATVDGTAGIKGFPTDAIRATKPIFDRFYCCGPMPMMKAVCQAMETGGEVSLEERMGCGAGFCYGCSYRTASGTKRICKDGPVFDKEDIIW